MPETLLVRRDGPVVELCLNRPERLNAFDVPSFGRFRAALEEVALDPSVRAVVLTGSGRAFCAGGDVAAMEEARTAGTLPTFFHDLTGEQERSVRAIVGMAKPVVAALPGVAAGGDSPSRSLPIGGSRPRGRCSSPPFRRSAPFRTGG